MCSSVLFLYPTCLYSTGRELGPWAPKQNGSLISLQKQVDLLASAFAGNPYPIDLVLLVEFGLVKPSELTPLEKLTVCSVDFGGCIDITV